MRAVFSVCSRDPLRVRYAGRGETITTMGDCKHGLRQGCYYCHASATAKIKPSVPKRRTGASRLSEQMNDRMTGLKRRLRELRGE